MGWLSDTFKKVTKTVAEVAQVAAPIVSPFLAGQRAVTLAPPVTSPTIARTTVKSRQDMQTITPIAGGVGPGGGAGGAGVVPAPTGFFAKNKMIILAGGAVLGLFAFLMIMKK